MANLSSNVKTAFLKGLEALGKTASTLSDAASQKLNEMNLDTRRREVLSQIPKCVMQLWKDGVELPEPLNALLEELTELENKLAALRPKHEAEKATEDQQMDETKETVETEAESLVEESAEEAAAPEEVFCDCNEPEQSADGSCNEAAQIDGEIEES